MFTDDEQLARAIKRVQYHHHRALDTALNAAGTTLAQWDALRAIALFPGASAHTLATETFQTDQAFGTLASRLVAQQLIERRPGHGRRLEHHLTPRGTAVLQAGQQVSQDLLATSFSRLSAQDRLALLDLLTRTGDFPER